MIEETPIEAESPHCPFTSPHGDPCTLTRGHEGLHERHVAGERLASWPESDHLLRAPAPFCGQRDPDHPDDGCCTLPSGHPRWQDDGDGDVWDHARLDANGEMIAGWNMPAPELRCQSRPAAGGWSTENTRCTLPEGHDGRHQDGAVTWGSLSEPDHLLRAFFDGVSGSPRLRVTPGNPSPVRVRFIDLPPRYEQREVLNGIPAVVVAIPGGFALVVDRFRDQAHCDAERRHWEEFGATVGAHVVVCYSGELDIYNWYAD